MKHEKKLKGYETVWSCDFCGEEFKTKKESDKHELICKKNPKNKKYNLSFKRLFSRIFLTGILSITFFIIMFPLLKKANYLPFDDKAEIGSMNMWRVVFLYGLLTSFFCFYSFIKKHFRMTAILLIFCWILGTSFVFIIESLDKKEMVSNSNNSILSVIEERIKCDEKATLSDAKKCTYLVIRDDGGHGTGIGANGRFIVTNKHVIEDSKEVSVLVNGLKQKAFIWNYSPSMDIAILKVNTDINSCSWFDSARLQIAENLYAVGWPNVADGESTVTKGIYSRTNSYDDGLEFIQTDAPINPGNSGGPLLNQCGVVGVNTIKDFWTDEKLPRPLEGLGNALSSKLLIPIVNQLIRDGSELTKIPQTPKTNSNKTYDQTPKVYLSRANIQSRLDMLYRAKREIYPIKDKFPKQDIDNLFDLFDRQISFCETLLSRVDDNKPATNDDVFMWDSVIKMAYESQLILQKLVNLH